MPRPLLEVQALKKHYPMSRGTVLDRQVGVVKAVDGISFSIEPRQIFALVGESGCGKTTTSRLILLLETATEGKIVFNGSDVTTFDRQRRRDYRLSVQAVFQDPFSSLNPRMRVGSIIAEPLEVQGTFGREQIKQRVADTMERVQLDPQTARRYPHMFSGGQRQRIALARALAVEPRLIVLDEPVSGLDVSIRAQILNLLQDLQADLGVSYLLISHDLATVRHMSHKVGVMYLGRIVEIGDCEDIYTNPLHPYTKALLSAALPSHPDAVREEIRLSGEPPSAAALPAGCRFHPRCGYADGTCVQIEPELRVAGGTHWVACHLANGQGV
jgi:oligopeptide transport system ATP-binding protein